MIFQMSSVSDEIPGAVAHAPWAMGSALPQICWCHQLQKFQPADLNIWSVASLLVQPPTRSELLSLLEASSIWPANWILTVGPKIQNWELPFLLSFCRGIILPYHPKTVDMLLYHDGKVFTNHAWRLRFQQAKHVTSAVKATYPKHQQ